VDRKKSFYVHGIKFLSNTENHSTGRKGEELAAAYLTELGYEIVQRNFRHRRYEIDLIVCRGDWLLFVEVKTRSSSTFGHPEDSVNAAQARRIGLAAEEFIFSTNWQGNIRFDIISVEMGSEVKITHFVDAFS